MTTFNQVFIIGIEHYEENGILPLPCATTDVERLSNVLVNSCGISPGHISLLADTKLAPEGVWIGPPTRAVILDRLAKLQDNLDSEGRILFYFAGHGAEISGKPYLLTRDSRMDVIKDTAVDVETINTVLADCNPRMLLRVYDCCRNPYIATRAAYGRMTASLEQSLLQKSRGWASWCSCSSGQVAYEDPDVGQGVFSYYLCLGLQGDAQDASGSVSLYGLADYVHKGVERWSQQHGVEQVPHIEIDIEGLAILTEPSHSVTENIPRMDPLESLAEFLRDHIDAAQPDIRSLTFSTDEEYSAILDRTVTSLEARFSSFAGPGITYECKSCGRPAVIKQRVWMQILQDMNKHGVSEEFTNVVNGNTTKVTGQMPIVPEVLLSVFVLRFSYCYWIWFNLACGKTSFLTDSFQPSPGETSGYYVIRAGDSSWESIVDSHLNSIFSVFAENTKQWSQQYMEFVVGKTEHLRDGQ